LNAIDFDRLQKIYEVSMAETNSAQHDNSLEPMDNVIEESSYYT
jgi:hypothetical protein